MNKKINITINKVYTKKGDKGKTDIIGEKGVFKSDIKVICYGEVDELNSSIGFCRSLIESCDDLKDQKMLNSIKTIQNDLFNLGTMLAISDNFKSEKIPKIEVFGCVIFSHMGIPRTHDGQTLVYPVSKTN